MDIEVYPVAQAFGAQAADDGSFVDVACTWGDGERFMLRLPLPVATAMQGMLQSGCAEASRRGGNEVRPPIAEAMALQPFGPTPDHEILTIRMQGGMQVHYLVPAGKYDRGILRLPDPRDAQGRNGDA